MLPLEDLRRLKWSREASLSFMDDAGINVAMLSISTPGVHVGDDRARSRVWRAVAMNSPRSSSSHGRIGFGSFAALPLPDVDGALEELSYALDVLRLDGVLLFSNVQGDLPWRSTPRTRIQQSSSDERRPCSCTRIRRPILWRTVLGCRTR